MRKQHLIFVLFLIFCVSAAGQEKLQPVRNLNILHGLAHNGVTAILEDSKGYLWFGTYEGLNRYDGYGFSVFKNTLEEEPLTSNRIRTLLEDSVGNIWIGTENGLSIYAYSKEKFIHLPPDSILRHRKYNKLVILKIIYAKEQQLFYCITEENGILVLDINHKLKDHFPYPQLQTNLLVSGASLLAHTKLLLASTNGLWCFDTQKTSFHPILQQHAQRVRNIALVANNTFLVIKRQGAFVAQFETKAKRTQFKFVTAVLDSLQLTSAAVDKLGSIWLAGETKGIYRVVDTNNFLTGKPFSYSNYAGENGFLRANIFAPNTRSGCWAATFDEGVFQFDTQPKAFKFFNQSKQLEHAPRTHNTLHLAAIDSARFYVSAYKGGLTIFNANTGIFEPLDLAIKGNSQYNVGGIFVDSRGNRWLRIANIGICMAPQGTKIAKPVHNQGVRRFNNAHIRAIKEYPQGTIWISGSSGVFRIKLNKQNEPIAVEDLKDHKSGLLGAGLKGRALFLDSTYNYAWVGTKTNGLLRISIEPDQALAQAKLDQFLTQKNDSTSLSNNFVTAITTLPNGELWVGTEGGGICRVDNRNKHPKFVRFSERDGLSNNSAKCLLYDKTNHLWIATNNGLNRFDTRTQQFRRFTKEDGLPFEDFWYAGQILKSGQLVFSSVHGFCYFKPEDLPQHESLPPLELSNFKLTNKSIQPQDTVNGRVLLQKRINETQKIVLKHDENNFSVELKSLHFSNPENYSIRYRLSPANKTWNEISSNQRYISYSGLPPGKYTLMVMASNSMKQWTTPQTLHIVIEPPFWKTTWAKLFYVLFMLINMYLVMRVAMRIQSLQHQIQLDQLETDKVKEVNEAKLRFFSNISHEIKTPLTLIMGPVEILLDRFKGNAGIAEKLQIVQRQSKRISQLIDQVHDFQRSDANMLKINYSTFNFSTFVNELMRDFEFMAQKDNKRLLADVPNKPVYVLADRDKLEKVFNNILSNAFKYSDAQASIRIRFRSDGHNLLITIADTGKGIDAEDLPHIFERFYQSKKKHAIYAGGSGIGLAFSKRLVEMHYGDIRAESQVGKGTSMHLRLPIVQEQHELAEETEHEMLTAEQAFVFDNKSATQISPSTIRVDGHFADASVFIVEDNLEMRNFIADTLSNFFRVKSFVNGQTCLTHLQKEWPDIIVSDVLMPEMNGFALCKAIKNDIKTSHIPVILLTACTSMDDQIKGLTQGADAYLKKPFNLQHLVSRMEALLRGRQQLRERYKIDLPLTLSDKDEGGNDRVFLEKLYQLMAENLDNTAVDLDGFAKELYLNRTHFYQKVKALTNQTPYELLKAYRIKKAAELLVQERLTVNEVYVMTGFKSRAHFSKLFKSQYGTTPGKYASDMLDKYSKNS